MIVFLTQDLVMHSSASAAAGARGHRIVAVPTAAAAVQQMNSHRITALFVDLQTKGLDIADLCHQLQQIPNRPTTIAFAQHVEDGLLQSAKGSVIDRVMTRGQFSHRLPQLLGELDPVSAPEATTED